MNDKVVDFQAGKENQLHKRREAKLDRMRRAFRLARAEADQAADPAAKRASRRRKKHSKSKK